MRAARCVYIFYGFFQFLPTTTTKDPDMPDRIGAHTDPLRDATQEMPSPRRRPGASRAPAASGAPADATRLDAHAMFDVAAPTVVTPRKAVRVSPPGTHTGGVGHIVDRLNLALDEQRIAAGRVTPGAGWRAKTRRTRKTPPTVREAAARRARAHERHVRHMEHVETVRAYMALLCLVALFVLVGGMAVISLMILTGDYTWAPVPR